jgi:hypothetical protein
MQVFFIEEVLEDISQSAAKTISTFPQVILA